MAEAPAGGEAASSLIRQLITNPRVLTAIMSVLSAHSVVDSSQAVLDEETELRRWFPFLTVGSSGSTASAAMQCNSNRSRRGERGHMYSTRRHSRPRDKTTGLGDKKKAKVSIINVSMLTLVFLKMANLQAHDALLVGSTQCQMPIAHPKKNHVCQCNGST